MKRRWIALSILALVGTAAFCIAPAATAVFHQDHAAVSAAGTCDAKHCPPNTHCCYSCSGSPICVRNGVPCPECAPPK
jgi:hypothetical protein